MGAWIERAASSRFVLRARPAPDGGLASLSITAFSEAAAEPAAPTEAPATGEPEAATDEQTPADQPAPHAQPASAAAAAPSPGSRPGDVLVGSRAEALQQVASLLGPHGGDRALVRTWLDVSIEVELLTGATDGQLLVHQFGLVGLLTDVVHRAADGRCFVRVFARIARLESAAEASFALPISLVADDQEEVAAEHPATATLEVQFAAGQWDAYAIASFRLATRGLGPHRLELRTSAGQLLWTLPLEVRPTHAGSAAAAAAALESAREPAAGAPDGGGETFPAEDQEQNEGGRY